MMSNLFLKGETMDMWFYLSEHEKFNDFGNEGAVVWHEANIPYAVWKPESTRTLSTKSYPSEILAIQNTILLAVSAGHTPLRLTCQSEKQIRRRVCWEIPNTQLNQMQKLRIWMVVTQISKMRALWNGYKLHGVPPNIAPYLLVEPTTGNYYPTVFFNEFWLLRDKLFAINETVLELPLNLEVSPISMTKWQLFQQIDQSFQIHRSYGSMLDGESDELKRVFLEGNPYLLGVTVFVSLLHSVFDFLAFKNDIQFWNKNKSMEGLSA